MFPIPQRKMMIYRYIALLLLSLTVLACSTDGASVKGEATAAPEESFRKANELIKDGFYEDARKILETVKSGSSSQYALLARLRIADSYFDDEAYEEAVVEYESFLDLYPHQKYASYAQYRLAMCYFKRIRTVDVSYTWARRALDEFRKLQRQYPRNPYMSIVNGRIQSCINMLAEYEYYVGNFYYEKGAYSAAIGRFSSILRQYPESVRAPEALYYMGLSYEYDGRLIEAINTLTAFVDMYPNMDLTVDAKEHITSLPHLVLEK
jgi:outer membrane protein assembly factor BamD